MYFWDIVNIVHLNTYDGNGGAGRACLRLSRALRSQGINSEVLVHYKFREDSGAQDLNFNKLEKAWTAATILLERLLARQFLKALRTPFSFSWFGRSVKGHPLVQRADILHLHWINHGLLNPRHLDELATLGKPVVWTFHDSNAFTGGCHVRYDCDHFEKQCGNCPLLKRSAPDDWSHRIWQQKHQAYSSLPFTIIAPSQWMADSVAHSSLMRGRRVLRVPNTLETDVFKPVDRRDARIQLNLPVDKRILLSGFMPSRKDQHKGTAYLMEALERLKTRLGAAASGVHLVVFGNRAGADLPAFPFETTFLGTISDDRRLASCFAAADAFLLPSLEDNLPYTVMESLSCGTPVIAFRTGGIPDMVRHLENGYLAEYRSSKSFTDGIEWFFGHPEPESLRAQARHTVEQQFSQEIIARRHMELYEELLTSVQQRGGNNG